MESHTVLEQLAEIVRILRKVERKLDEQDKANDAWRASQAAIRSDNAGLGKR